MRFPLVESLKPSCFRYQHCCLLIKLMMPIHKQCPQTDVLTLLECPSPYPSYRFQLFPKIRDKKCCYTNHTLPPKIQITHYNQTCSFRAAGELIAMQLHAATDNDYSNFSTFSAARIGYLYLYNRARAHCIALLPPKHICN